MAAGLVQASRQRLKAQHQSETTLITIAAIAKNEGPYLLEWIAYHRVVGADRIVIMDNDSTDGSQFLLRALDGIDAVTYIPWPTRTVYKNFEKHRTGPQVPAYHFAWRLEQHLGRTGWIGFIDLDEFVVPTAAESIGEVLGQFPEASAVGVNWRIFGSGGLETQPAGLVMKNFTRRAADNFTANRHVKTFARVSKIINPGIHVPSRLDGPIVDVAGEKIDLMQGGVLPSVASGGMHINHYFTKSRAEWERKRRRGRAPMVVSDPRRIRDNSVFDAHDRNEVEDASILRFLPETLAEIGRLRRKIRLWLPQAAGLFLEEDG